MAGAERNDPLIDALFKATVAWLVPGAGHFLLGQRWRGIAFFVLLTGTFAIGLALTGGAAVSLDDHRLAFVAQVLAGLPALAGVGLDALREAAGQASLRPDVVTMIDLGLLFTMVPGLLNLLLVLDAFERAFSATEKPA